MRRWSAKSIGGYFGRVNDLSGAECQISPKKAKVFPVLRENSRKMDAAGNRAELGGACFSGISAGIPELPD
jgi:hypothetical protein